MSVFSKIEFPNFSCLVFRAYYSWPLFFSSKAIYPHEMYIVHRFWPHQQCDPSRASSVLACPLDKNWRFCLHTQTILEVVRYDSIALIEASLTLLKYSMRILCSGSGVTKFHLNFRCLVLMIMRLADFGILLFHPEIRRLCNWVKNCLVKIGSYENIEGAYKKCHPV